MFIVEIGAVWSTDPGDRRPVLVRLADRGLAVADGDLRQPRRGRRRGPRQGAGRVAAQDQDRDHGPSPHRTGRRAAPGREEEVAAPLLQQGDIVVVEAGQVIPGDGDVVEGIASVDESAITGESAPVIRESGGDRSAVTGGTTVLSDRIVVKITQKPGESFIDRMIALVEGANRQKTPNEIALNILLAALTIIFVFAVATLQPLAIYSKANNPGVPDTLALTGNGVTGIVMVALLVCLIPTTIGALLSAIGIAGMDRLVQRNVLAMSGRAVEAAGDVNTLLLDKTGTITLGNRQAAAFVPLTGVSRRSSWPTPRSCPASPTRRRRAARSSCSPSRSTGCGPARRANSTSALGRVHRDHPDVGCRPRDGHQLRKGAASSVAEWVRSQGGDGPRPSSATSSTASPPRAAPRWWSARCSTARRSVLGVIHLKDVVKQGMRERFDEMRRMGIRTVMITGDNPLTAKAIADEAGVDDFLAEATPEDKMALIKSEQEGGKLVAMTGDGTNDAPALAQADVGVAMNTGTSAAKEAGNMVDLDSDPTKLIEIVEIGKQLLITRGALTTFSIANDIAKYFAIIPAMFVALFPGLDLLNVMRLHSPQSAILSAVIFNAIVIVALIPLSLRGVRYTPSSASKLLSRNLYIYGLGGIIAPFIGIKLIDLVVQLFPGCVT